MPIPTYIEGYPQNGSSLGNTRDQIRNNLDGTFETLGTDHINNNGVGERTSSGTPGFHDVMHFQDQGNLYTRAPQVSGSTQMYTNTSNSAKQVIYQTDTVDRNAYVDTLFLDAFYSTFGTDPGWCYLSAGLVVQWGFVAVPFTSDQAVITPITYTKQIFFITIVPTYTTPPVPPINVSTFTRPSTTMFNRFNFTATVTGSGTSNVTGIKWLTIGTML